MLGDRSERERDVRKTVNKNDHKMTDGRRQSVQQESDAARKELH